MFETNGPLPPEIYQRRRWLAIGLASFAILVVIGLIAVIAGGGGDDPSPTAAASSETPTTTQTPASASATPSGSETASGTATTSGAATSGAASPAAATPPGQCPDSSLAVKATIAQPTYKVGQEPEFGIVITNISTAPCERDLGAGLQQVLVYTLDGVQRLWSNSDCFPSATPDLRTLTPGQQAAFTVKWSGTTSQPECAGERVPVAPGAYTVIAQLGALRSGAEPFNLA
ncbi:hypothetical protein [Aldersonia kunmingensis]|uniref:hypothetical protein n=1 Tax=Aldersonia kunmingensis TaxID=408066 RepID=UPI00082FDBBE|nr:hypothetical protein [Aldersonia kunmingensis]